jgi:Holliday junction resolvase RusA-like endonuclease
MTIVPTKDDPTLVAFDVPGEPHGKARPRFVRSTGHAYTPTATRLYEASIGYMARRAMAGLSWFLGPVALAVDAIFSVPASWSNTKKQQALTGIVRPTGKPDADNIVKAVGDALNEIVWRDDSQVVDCRIRKFYGAAPMLRITIKPASLPKPEQEQLPWHRDTETPSIGRSKTSSE